MLKVLKLPMKEEVFGYLINLNVILEVGVELKLLKLLKLPMKRKLFGYFMNLNVILEVGVEHPVGKSSHANPNSLEHTVACQLVHLKFSLKMSLKFPLEI